MAARGEDVKNLQATIDKTAIGLSLVCSVHCLLLPVAMATLPALTASSLEDEWFHRALLVAVLPTSMIALTMGCRKHRHWRVAVLGLAGLVVLTATAYFGHEVLGETGEKLATLSAAALIAFGHFKNHALCRKSRCHC